MRTGAFACAACAAFVCVPAVLLAAGVTVVTQRGRAFDASQIEIRAGDTVRFSNRDAFGHQVYVEDAAFTFRSDEQAPGSDLDVRFPVRGVFGVLCEIHPKMHLRVAVR